MAPTLHEAADRLETEAQRSGVLADDPLATLLHAAASLARTMADTAGRLETLGSQPLDNQVTAAVERASTGIALRVAGHIDRRAAITVAAALFFAAAIGGAIGYVAGAVGQSHAGPIAVCWQQKGERVCSPAVWLNAGGGR